MGQQHSLAVSDGCVAETFPSFFGSQLAPEATFLAQGGDTKFWAPDPKLDLLAVEE